jgi:hypothetical protein
MSVLKTILISIFTIIFSDNICVAQSYKIDTVIVDGYLVTYIERKEKKAQTDLTRGYFFFMGNLYDSCKKKKKSETLFEIDRKQNAIFLLEYGGSFFTLNALFFNGSLNAMKLNETNYPTEVNYSFKDKKYFYQCTPIRVKCLRVNMSEKVLFHFIAFDQYTFNIDKIPVYIVQETVKLK